MGWFNDVKSPKLKSSKKVNTSTPTGLWKKCSSCGEIVQQAKIELNNNVCPYCDHHFRISASERLALLVDENSFRPMGEKLGSKDPLSFSDKKEYKSRLDDAFAKTGQKDGTLAGMATIEGSPVALAIMSFEFMGGSMGVVTGEKITMVLEAALENNCPAVVLSCSGGARMQEGVLSLMQMAKTSAAISRLKAAGLPYISILTDPTTGGCAASFSMLGDLNIAEPKALIGFAGPRVIEQSIRQRLPEGFQTAEFLKERGFVDRIVHRNELRSELAWFLKLFADGRK